MASLPERQHSTVAQIIQWRERQDANEQPPYLGASQIGGELFTRTVVQLPLGNATPVRRAHVAPVRTRPARRGRIHCRASRHRRNCPRRARAGKQFGVQSCGGHFRGHMDGAAIGLPEAPDTWHVLEFKTHNAKSFADLQKNGVAKIKTRASRTNADLHGTDRNDASHVSGCQQRHR